MQRLKVIHFLSVVYILSLLSTLFFVVSDIYPDPAEYPERVHVTLYLDRNFDEFETELTMQAALEWSKATNHRVEYDVIQLPTREKINYKNSVFIAKRSIDDPQVILMDLAGGNQTLGVYEKRGLPHITIVGERVNYNNFKEIMLHELGHSLGLEHLEGLENIDALMFPYTDMNINGLIVPTGSDHITSKDVKQFCELYHCDPAHL